MGAVPQWTALVVEDDEDCAFLLRAALRRLGCGEVTLCSTGEEALRRCADGLPDLITTDRRLPGMSGDELVNELSRAHGDRCPPILVLSANAREPIENPAVRGVLLKPYRIAQLEEVVRVALDGR